MHKNSTKAQAHAYVLFAIATISVAFIIFATLPVEKSSAQVQTVYDPVYYGGDLTLSATTATASTTTVITSQAVRMLGNRDVAFFPNFVLATGSATGNVTLNFQVSIDGATWTSVTPFTYAVAANGTTQVRGFTSFGKKDGFNNVRYIRLASVTNANAADVNTLTVKWRNFAE